MSVLDRLRLKKKEMEVKLQKARELNEVRKAEKFKHKKERIKSMEPGTIRYGLATKQSVGSFFKDSKKYWDKKLGVNKDGE